MAINSGKISNIYFILILLNSVFFIFNCSTITSDSEYRNKREKALTRSIREFEKSSWIKRIEIVHEFDKYEKTELRERIRDFYIKRLNDSHPAVRLEILKSLTKYNSYIIIDKIVSVIENDPNNNVKIKALELLGTYPHIEGKKVFIGCLKNDDWLIREKAYTAMLKTSTTDEQSRLIIYILEGLHSGRTPIVKVILENIKFKHRLILKELKKIIISTDTNYSLLKAALKQLDGYQFDEETEERLTKLLLHWDSKVRILSLRALKKNKLLKEI